MNDKPLSDKQRQAELTKKLSENPRFKEAKDAQGTIIVGAKPPWAVPITYR